MGTMPRVELVRKASSSSPTADRGMAVSSMASCMERATCNTALRVMPSSTPGPEVRRPPARTPKKFELALYKGDVYPPVVLEDAGVVVLGCNIHDGMIGYIVVVDTPHFARTNERGIATLANMSSGSYAVSAWTPRVRPSGLPPAQQVAISEGAGAIEIRIAGRLAPAHSHGTSSLTWERY